MTMVIQNYENRCIIVYNVDVDGVRYGLPVGFSPRNHKLPSELEHSVGL